MGFRIVGWTPKILRKAFLGSLVTGSFSFIYFNLLSTKLEIIGQESEHNAEIINAMRELRTPIYRTSFLLPFRFMEIIFGCVFDKRDYFKYKREIIHSFDNERLALDWGQLHAKVSELSHEMHKIPVVVVLPGLSGDSSAPYLKASMTELRSGGFRTVVANLRGSGVSQITHNIFDYRNTEKDLEVVVRHIHHKFPKANIYFMGFSYGASYGTTVMARNQDIVKGMFSVANPFDVYKAGISLNSNTNAIYA